MLSYPGDWEVMRLSDFAEINPHTTIPEKFYYVDLESVKDIYLINARRETKYTAPSRARRYARKGDVFFQTVRPYQRNNYIFKLDGDYVFSTGYAQLRTNNNPDFLFYLVRHDGFVNEVLENCTGTSYPAINPATLAKILVHIPTLKEQTAIANTLAAFDTHITNLTELISKKKAIRDGALDDLMTGRTRLKGFCGDWEVKTLGECVTILQGGTPSTLNPLYWEGDIVWVTPSDITKLHSMYISDSERKITHAGLKNSSATIVPAGSILLCSRATIGELAIATRPMATNQGFKNLICRENINNVFLAYLLLTLKKVMITLSRGTTFLELSKTSLQSIKISFPPLDEQTAIAETLTALDTEILSLETERAKISQIRDGAMNELLTGNVRLIDTAGL